MSDFVPERIYEGDCPHGHGPLERQTLDMSADEEGLGPRFTYGWCGTCEQGWSASNGFWQMYSPPGYELHVPEVCSVRFADDGTDNMRYVTWPFSDLSAGTDPKETREPDRRP